MNKIKSILYNIYHEILPAGPVAVSTIINTVYYRVFPKSVPEPLSSGAAKYSEVSIYPKAVSTPVLKTSCRHLF